jgi:hypothetical protein
MPSRLGREREVFPAIQRQCRQNILVVAVNDPNSIEGWLQLSRSHEGSAKLLAENKDLAAQGFWHAGMAVECALKAYIFKKERFNDWPSKERRPDLWTHDLRELVKVAGIVLKPSDPTAAAWHVVLQWDRAQGYDPKPMPRKVARSMVEASFGPAGVATWIRQNLI